MTKLHYIEIHWFGSIKELKYRFDGTGINAIQGPNGAGKTSIYNALCWGLYKQTIKKNCTIEPWPHIVDDSYMGTMVKVSFTSNTGTKCSIIRCKNYRGKIGGKSGANRVLIFEDNQEVNTERDKMDINQWVVKKLGYSFTLFKNSVLFGQLVTRLAEEGGPEKKKVFDEAFETSFISRALDKAKETLEDLEDSYEGIEVKKKHQQELYKQLLGQFIAARRIKRDFKEAQKNKLKKAKEEIAELSKSLNSLKFTNNIPALEAEIIELEKKVNSLNEANNREFKLSMQITSLKEKLDKNTDEVEVLKSQVLSKICSSCGQKVNNSKSRKTVKDRIKELNIVSSTLIKELDEREKEHKKISKSLEKLTKAQNQLISSRRQLSTAWDLFGKQKKIRIQIAEKKKRIEEIKGEKPPVVNLKELNEKKESALSKYKNLEELQASTKKKLNLYTWLVKDPLSNSGLKAFIFDSMLHNLNTCLNQYSFTIGFRIKVYVDMSSAHKNIAISIFKDKEEVPYEDLSGGQRQLVNLTLAFALNDTVCLSKPINCLLMDELFESLDKSNIEVVTEMVSEKSQQKCIHIITHHTEFSPINKRGITLRLNKTGQTVLA